MLEKIRRNFESFAWVHLRMSIIQQVNTADKLANSPNCHIKKCMKLSKEN